MSLKKTATKMKSHVKDDDVILLDDDIKLHSTKAGRLYIEPAELFARKKTKEMVLKLIASSIYKQIELVNPPK